MPQISSTVKFSLNISLALGIFLGCFGVHKLFKHIITMNIKYITILFLYFDFILFIPIH